MTAYFGVFIVCAFFLEFFRCLSGLNITYDVVNYFDLGCWCFCCLACIKLALCLFFYMDIYVYL